MRAFFIPNQNLVLHIPKNLFEINEWIAYRIGKLKLNFYAKSHEKFRSTLILCNLCLFINFYLDILFEKVFIRVRWILT